MPGRGALWDLPSGDEDLATVPSIGRALGEPSGAPEADLTRSLYERHANQIFRYCLHQLGSREEAEDAVQSTFLNAFRGIKRGVVPELEAAWLFKIAHNVCLSRRRSAWRRGRVESPTDFDLVEELMPAPARRADELIGLQDVLEQMPDAQRRAILLREWQGLSYREIADELELSQAAVETLIFRARRSLAAGLEEAAVPPRRRIARALDWGNLVAGLKSFLLGGSVAAKVAATVAVVGATTVAATSPIVQHRAHRTPPPAKPVAHHSAARKATHAAPPAAAAAAPRRVVRAPARGAVRHRHVDHGAPSAGRPVRKRPNAESAVSSAAADAVEQTPAAQDTHASNQGQGGRGSTHAARGAAQDSTTAPTGRSSSNGTQAKGHDAGGSKSHAVKPAQAGPENVSAADPGHSSAAKTGTAKTAPSDASQGKAHSNDPAGNASPQGAAQSQTHGSGHQGG